ncbi:hypothetical protein HaLaN_21964, partial [Haematococcus lacustris]
VLLGHVGRGGRSRRGPHEQNWHEFECSALSRHSTQHTAHWGRLSNGEILACNGWLPLPLSKMIGFMQTPVLQHDNKW